MAYTYAGYPALLWLLTRGRRREPPPEPEDAPPRVDLIVAAREEAGTIENLLHSCTAIDYPSGRLQVTVVVTGERGATLAAVESCRDALTRAGLRLSVLLGDPADPSKGAALNQAVLRTDGELLIFTDANVRLDRQAIRALVRWFALPDVGAVSGRKRPVGDPAATSGSGDRAYWSYEAFVKEREALLSSAAGADGALFALRRELYRPTLSCADDLAISLAVIRQGRRIAFARDALAYESSTRRLGDEFRRRLRTLACGLDELIRASDLCSPARPVFAWIVCSHKLMRYVAAYALLGMLIGSAGAKGRGYRALLVAQLSGYVLALAGGITATSGRVRPSAAVPLYALTAQAAAVLAPFRLLRRRQSHWTPTPR